ncbi:hypothetical protein KSP35_07720 [Aquihabitans sp. G128]|uniref:hypothetical protein n=1 Tax=Aquihabitans sp. G128 TaxID=2849779 RepID=UPI001C224FF3|nr:hypothetical protein [Aquihabitans sp. G128]QXC62673.1 hypothetical protein KSP35_07720 [Aquihabitans sp. G128]
MSEDPIPAPPETAMDPLLFATALHRTTERRSDIPRDRPERRTPRSGSPRSRFGRRR